MCVRVCVCVCVCTCVHLCVCGMFVVRTYTQLIYILVQVFICLYATHV